MSTDFFSPRFYYTWAAHRPSLTVPSGACVRVICPDSDGGLADGSRLSAEQCDSSTGAPYFAGNPLAGPINVARATAQDCIAIDIHAIDLDRPTGATLLAPAHGFLSRDELLGSQAAESQEAIPRRLYEWRLDADRQEAMLANPLGRDALAAPLRPMVGCLGVTPAWGQSLASLYAGTFGGNLDLPLLRPGATLFLPVHIDGGGVLIGDLHAAQGAGEIVGGGVETSGAVTMTLRRLVDRPIPAPRLIVDDRLYAVATEGDLRLAVSAAYARLLDWLTMGFGLHRWDAHQLLSQTCVMELGGLSVANCLTAAAGVAVDRLPSRCQEELERWLAPAGR